MPRSTRSKRERAVLTAALVATAITAVILMQRDDEFARRELYHVKPIKVGDAPQAVAAGEGALWVTNAGEGTVSRIDLRTQETDGEPIPVDPIPSGIAAGEGSVWVGFGEGASSVFRIDPLTKRVVSKIRIGRAPSSIAVGEGHAWVAAIVGDVLARIDPFSGRVEAKAPKKALSFPSAVAVGLGSVWVTDVTTDELIELDPRTLKVAARYDVGASPTAVAVGEGAVWVASFDATVTRIDPHADAEPKDVGIAAKPGGITTGEGFVWVSLPRRDSLVRIDASETKVVGRLIPVGNEPQGLTYADGNLWVATQGNDTVARVDLHPEVPERLQ